MSTYKSSQQTNLDAMPRVNLKPNELGGRKRIAFWEFTTDAVVAVEVDQTIDLVTLPKGARILGGFAVSEAMGGASTVDIGVSGTPAKYASVLDIAAAGADPFANTIALNYGSVLTAETVVFATIKGAVWAANKKFNGHINYAVD